MIVTVAGGFYHQPLTAQLSLVSLNTNLWYKSNQYVQGEEDPGAMFRWVVRYLPSLNTVPPQLAGGAPVRAGGVGPHRLDRGPHPARQVREVLPVLRRVQGLRHTRRILGLPLAEVRCAVLASQPTNTQALQRTVQRQVTVMSSLPWLEMALRLHCLQIPGAGGAAQRGHLRPDVRPPPHRQVQCSVRGHIVHGKNKSSMNLNLLHKNPIK